jgi:carboxypeptidase Q
MSEAKNRFCAICFVPLSLFFCASRIDAQQTPQTPVAASNLNTSPSPTPAVFLPQTLAELKRLQQAALSSDYAYKQVAHLANNIGPRLSGSAQAAKSVQYVASELKALGCEVQLERVMVPHWVRGEETAALVQFPGQAENTIQKIVLCALGESVATPAGGITADVVVAKNFEELKALPRDKVAG